MAAKAWSLALALALADALPAAQAAPARQAYVKKQEILALVAARAGALCDAPRLKGCILVKRNECATLMSESVKRCETTYGAKLGAQYIDQAAATKAAEPINLCIIKDVFAAAAKKKKLLNTADCTTPPAPR